MSEIVSKAEAIAALRGAAFEVTDEDDSAHGRTLIHCVMGFTGADWDLAEAIETVERSTFIAWLDHPLGHDLQVTVGPADYHFQVKRPAPSHLDYVTSDRGFKRLPPILSAYPGGEVKVYESSAAMGPHIWLAATAPVNLNDPNGDKFTSPIHLTVEDAWKLADQLRHLVRHHYQMRGDEQWLTQHGSSE